MPLNGHAHYRVIGLISLAFMGLDWGDWVYGLAAAIIQGGATSVASGFSLLVIAPESFNMAHPALIVKAMLTMFVVNGMISGFSFLRNKPVPEHMVETTHTTTRVQQEGQPTATITAVETRSTEPGPKQSTPPG